MTGATLVVVAARNEARRLGATLAALASAFPGGSRWVDDDGSSDETATVAARAGARVVSGARRAGKGAAMTLAVSEALDAAAVAEKTAKSRQAEQERVVLLCDGDLGESAGRLG